jgi:hypothetical protein
VSDATPPPDGTDERRVRLEPERKYVGMPGKLLPSSTSSARASPWAARRLTRRPASSAAHKSGTRSSSPRSSFWASLIPVRKRLSHPLGFSVELARLAVVGLLAGCSGKQSPTSESLAAPAATDATVDLTPVVAPEPSLTPSVSPPAAPPETALAAPSSTPSAIPAISATTTARVASPSARTPTAKACCKGKNECRGKGMCKTAVHDCAGLNGCKGQGGCKPADCK